MVGSKFNCGFMEMFSRERWQREQQGGATGAEVRSRELHKSSHVQAGQDIEVKVKDGVMHNV